MVEAAGFARRFVRPPRGFAPPDGVTAVDRLGQEVRVTTIERTIAGLFDRYDLAGGVEELFNSLDAKHAATWSLACGAVPLTQLRSSSEVC